MPDVTDKPKEAPPAQDRRPAGDPSSRAERPDLNGSKSEQLQSKPPERQPEQKPAEQKPESKSEPKAEQKPEQKPEQKKDVTDEKGRDTKAQKIIRDAKDEQVPMKERAEKAVRDILEKYYPTLKVKDVVYDPKLKSGLETDVGNKDGKIHVSDQFVKDIDRFARRVLQVGHELQHIEQYRQGRSSPEEKHPREFEANASSSRAQEKEGTGRMPDEMRRAYAAEALRHYDQMSKPQQEKYKAEKEQLEQRYLKPGSGRP